MLALLLPLLLTQSPALSALLSAEHAFARRAQTEGTHAAFLSVMHPEGLVFQPRPVSGIQLHKGKAENGSLLSWYPALADVSAAGDLGWTTGPWEFRSPREAPVSAQGWFVTVWIREGSGPWRLLVDLGSSNPVPASLPPALPDGGLAATGSVPPPELPGSVALLQEDREFAREVAQRGRGAAYTDRLAPTARVQRKGHFPATGGAALALVGSETHTWRPEASRVASSGDLGFTRGTLLVQEKETGAYLRIWKKAAQGWQVVLEVVSPY
jgi:ketosteroid isomerase-like protein